MPAFPTPCRDSAAASVRAASTMAWKENMQSHVSHADNNSELRSDAKIQILHWGDSVLRRTRGWILRNRWDCHNTSECHDIKEECGSNIEYKLECVWVCVWVCVCRIWKSWVGCLQKSVFRGHKHIRRYKSSSSSSSNNSECVNVCVCARARACVCSCKTAAL